jgi:hypothetical protein
MRQRTNWFRIQYLLCERIDQQAIFSKTIDIQTAARMEPKLKVSLTEHQEGMERPSAPVSGGPKGAVEERCGKTLTAAPVSTKKRCSVELFWR